MLPTHALWGMALALSAAVVAPEFAGVALVAGLLGGIFPDLDMYIGHRKTLHFPTYYAALALLAVPVMLLVPTMATVAAGYFLLAAASHSLADIFGGGLELRPWEGTSDRAVYDHHRRRWIAPRRLVGYDGSPGDLLLSVGLGVPLLLVLEPPLHWVVVAALAVAGVYTAVRRTLPTIAEWLFSGTLARVLPASVRPYVPPRYLGGSSR